MLCVTMLNVVAPGNYTTFRFSGLGRAWMQFWNESEKSNLTPEKKMKLPVLELIVISIWAACNEFKCRLENVLNASNLPEPNWVVSPMLYKMSIIYCRIFEHFALQTDPVTEFIKLRSALCKEGAILVPKLADLLSFWTSGSTPFILK